MATFYFTYGSDERFPFWYGWTEIEAPDMATACAAFRHFHPNRDPEDPRLNCADYYTEAEFKATGMYEKGNCYGTYCYERITLTLTREVFTQKGSGARGALKHES